MRCWLALACVVLVGCKPLPYKLERAEAGEDEKEEPVVLYGHDDDAPRSAPESCKVLGRIEASSLGEDSFPAGKLREEARIKGGNGVTRIKAHGKEDGYLGVTRHFRAQAVRCPTAPAAGSASAGGPPSSASAQP